MEKLQFIREHWLASLGILFLLISLIMLILSLSGKLDCAVTSIRNGVIKTCDCRGLEISVKSTESSGEQKTICIGGILNKHIYK